MNHLNNQSVVRSFIGKHADDLGNLISVQIKPIYESLGIVVPVKSCSIIHYLNQNNLIDKAGASLADLSKSLKQSHQLVKQKLPRLLKLGLIEVQQDANDKRRLLYSLTRLGNEQAKLLNENSLEKVYADLSAEIGTDLYQVLVAAINGLKKKDLLTRFNEQNKR
ncbi:MarR family transcriptional regulator [Marinicella litoralis]|uniref:DNA-binding MarR family transcriptional regulator n=1 Tax=Marinicella litoralis TaxID=644220 RepID=A0A4R6XWC5_9GAMM|nr:MarR family transcriptional regulator [Marinicella litoralis]TDR22740.1 DNA-binding MarR family transcriptional regulator [Marinicella litoralis]